MKQLIVYESNVLQIIDRDLVVSDRCKYVSFIRIVIEDYFSIVLHRFSPFLLQHIVGLIEEE